MRTSLKNAVSDLQDAARMVESAVDDIENEYYDAQDREDALDDIDHLVQEIQEDWNTADQNNQSQVAMLEFHKVTGEKINQIADIIVNRLERD